MQVKKIGYHKSLVIKDNKKLRLYPDDVLVCVFGNRYATDAYEGEVDGLDNICMLTAAGMIGTLKSKHKEIEDPTLVSFLGFIGDKNGNILNLKEKKFTIHPPIKEMKNLILVLGTGMNAGKTTTARKLIKLLTEAGLSVVACKLTGSVSNRDQDEMRAASPKLTIDFSDYGFPSTYMCDKSELVSLFNAMLSDISKTNPDVIIMEIADGILQRETDMLLKEECVLQNTKGVVLAANDAPSAIYAANRMNNMGYTVIAVSGSITSSPLSTKEFAQHSSIPICSSANAGRELTNTVINFLDNETIGKTLAPKFCIKTI
ncbi:MAG: hypothetical protein EPO63_06555 [Candidatus Nitrosotenuis sp.]|nr:MAG: hypothetical protein EPO63_06555 [Candidatus Nitrosotenuis sp.]